MNQIGEIVFAVVQSTKQVVALEIKGIVGIKTAEGDSAKSYQLEMVDTGEAQTVAIEDVYNDEADAHQAALTLINGEVEQATQQLTALVNRRAEVVTLRNECIGRTMRERMVQVVTEEVTAPEVHANAKSNKRRRRRKAKKAQKES